MLKIINASKTFNVNNLDLHALKDVNLHVLEGQIYAIIGLSGAGKSTLLRSIASLEKLDNGTILINGDDFSKLKGKELREKRKNIGIVFQGYNLLMQKTVFKNISFPLDITGEYTKEETEKRVNELLELVGLVGKENSYPSELSGGQRQRVAIARALATNPKILLLDELTSALDPLTTKQILKILKNINEKMNVTMLLITHEINVVKSIADYISVLNYGEIVESGTKDEVLHNPKEEITRLLIGKEDSSWI